MAPQSGEPPLSILLLNHLWFAPELRARGHQVLTASWIHDNADLKVKRYSTLDALLELLPEGFKPDRIVYYDDSHLPSVLGLEAATAPTVFYSIDAHHHHSWHRYFAECFDLTLVAQRDYLRKLAWDGDERSLHWFPVWTPAVLTPHRERSIEVCFRGTLDPSLHPQRHRFFTELRALVDVDAGAGPYWRDYPKAKIVINQTIAGDLNFRVFEGLSAEALLITPRIGNGLTELFTDGVELVTYREGDAAEAAERIRYYLEHDEERARIAAAGRQAVLARHTATLRAVELEQLLGTLTKRTARAARFAAGVIESATAMHIVRECGEDVTVKRLALRSIEHFIASAERHELLNDDFRAHAVFTKALLRRYCDPETRLEFSARISAAFPDDVLLALSLADDLLALGRSDQALQLAQQFSDRPEELLKAVPRLMGEVLKSVQLAGDGWDVTP